MPPGQTSFPPACAWPHRPPCLPPPCPALQPPLADAESIRDNTIAKLFEDLSRQGLDANHPFAAYGGNESAAEASTSAAPERQPSRLRSLLSLGKRERKVSGPPVGVADAAECQLGWMLPLTCTACLQSECSAVLVAPGSLQTHNAVPCNWPLQPANTRGGDLRSMVQQMIEDAKRASAANSSTCAWWRCAWTCDKSLHPHQADLPSQAATHTTQRSSTLLPCPADPSAAAAPSRLLQPAGRPAALDQGATWREAGCAGGAGGKCRAAQFAAAAMLVHRVPCRWCSASGGVLAALAHKAAALLTSRIHSPVHPACVCVQEAHHRVDEHQETMGAANPEDQEEWHRLMWLKCESSCCSVLVWMRRAACGMMLWPGYRLWRTWSCRPHTVHWAASWLAWLHAQSVHAWHARART